MTTSTSCVHEHNYREFLFGFEDWVHTLADADHAEAYRSKFTGEETRSMWQSLGFGPKYKSAYCQAVCPAGDEVIGPYIADRAAWRTDVMLPLLRKEENIYVRSGTRAERRRPAEAGEEGPLHRLPARGVVAGELRARAPAPFRPHPRETDITVAVRFVFPDQSACTATIKDSKLQLDDERDAEIG